MTASDHPRTRFNQLVAEAPRSDRSRLLRPVGTTVMEVAEAIGQMYLAEGKIMGYLKILTSPSRISPEKQVGSGDVRGGRGSVMLTMPDRGSDELFPQED